MNNDAYNYEDEDNIFNKHNLENKKLHIVFDNDVINSNKNLLKEFTKNKIISQNHHFSIEDSEMNEEDDKYFGNVIENTLKNENLYCSYLDYFDKMWIGNKTKSKEYIILECDIISCPNCFTEISYESIKKENGIAIAKNAVNFFEDYFEIYNTDQLVDMIKESIKNISDEQLKEIGIEDSEKQYISIKCGICYSELGIKDTFNKCYVFFNLI